MYLTKDEGKSKSSSDDANVKKTEGKSSSDVANVKKPKMRFEPFEDADDDFNDEGEDEYGPPMTLEGWNEYLRFIGKDGGYDVECFPPTCQFATFIHYPAIKLDGWKVEIDDDDDDDDDDDVDVDVDDDDDDDDDDDEDCWLYTNVKEAAEMVINDINAKSTDGTYQLEDLDHVIWSTNFTTLVTLITAKVIGADADRPVTKRTFQATMYIPPAKAMEIMSYRVKPGPGVEEDDDNFRYKNPRFYHT